MLVLVEIGFLMLMVDLLIHFISYLSSWLLLVVRMVSLRGLSLVCKSWHND
jgi:hypothetical protein